MPSRGHLPSRQERLAAANAPERPGNPQESVDSSFNGLRLAEVGCDGVSVLDEIAPSQFRAGLGVWMSFTLMNSPQYPEMAIDALHRRNFLQ